MQRRKIRRSNQGRLIKQRKSGNSFEEQKESPQPSIVAAMANVKSRSGLDAITPGENHLDQAAGGGGAAAPAAAAPALARPTNLIQILTSWAPGPNRYGFQLKFRCRSTSGNVRDLQNQAPNLIWRERVTYSRNDFAHRINPNNPTILPAGGVSFSTANTTIKGRNLLEFTGTTDTHWMPKSAVRSGDFVAPPGFMGPVMPLPAIMQSRQVYQYSANGGGAWNYLAGAFNIRRTFFRTRGGQLRFRIRKSGIHSVTENYKP